MTERPILFSAPMVRALLDGTKTQTRRIAKLNHAGRVHRGGRNWHVEDACAIIACPYGAAGDTLWVRETHSIRVKPENGTNGRGIAWYRATSAWDGQLVGWRPSIHMPRWASRITLKIAEVRIERLNEISNEDAAAEGWPGPDETGTIRSSYPIAWYCGLWESINGKNSWYENPWVWALTFEAVKQRSSRNDE